MENFTDRNHAALKRTAVSTPLAGPEALGIRRRRIIIAPGEKTVYNKKALTCLWKLAGSPKAVASGFADVAANAPYAQGRQLGGEQGYHRRDRHEYLFPWQHLHQRANRGVPLPRTEIRRHKNAIGSTAGI